MSKPNASVQAACRGRRRGTRDESGVLKRRDGASLWREERHFFSSTACRIRVVTLCYAMLCHAHGVPGRTHDVRPCGRRLHEAPESQWRLLTFVMDAYVLEKSCAGDPAGSASRTGERLGASGLQMESAPDVFLNTDGKRSGLKLFQFAAPVAVEPRRGVRARPAVRTWSARTDSDRTEKVPHGT